MEVKLKKLTKRERFAPLMAYEDRERAKYFLFGAFSVIILNIVLELFT